METCIYNIAEICWGQPEPRPGLFLTLTWCEKSDNLIYSPIHQLYPGSNTAVTSVLGGRWRTGGGSRGGGGRGDGIGWYLFSRTTTSWKTWKVSSAVSWSNQHFFLSQKKIHPFLGWRALEALKCGPRNLMLECPCGYIYILNLKRSF